MMVQFMKENYLNKKVKSVHKMDRFEPSCYIVQLTIKNFGGS